MPSIRYHSNLKQKKTTKHPHKNSLYRYVTRLLSFQTQKVWNLTFEYASIANGLLLKCPQVSQVPKLGRQKKEVDILGFFFF